MLEVFFCSSFCTSKCWQQRENQWVPLVSPLLELQLSPEVLGMVWGTSGREVPAACHHMMVTESPEMGRCDIVPYHLLSLSHHPLSHAVASCLQHWQPMAHGNIFFSVPEPYQASSWTTFMAMFRSICHGPYGPYGHFPSVPLMSSQAHNNSVVLPHGWV